MSLAALYREWRARLEESGFKDIEDGRGTKLRTPRPQPPLPEGAREALWEPKVWKGLPPRARRLWGYVVLAGFSPRRAAETMGISRHRAYAWVMVIRGRIG